MNDAASLRKAVAGSAVVFAVTNCESWNHDVGIRDPIG